MRNIRTGMLSGRVAAILTERDVALNIGYERGVTEGMVFAVLNRNANAITDPDSGEVLGSVPLPKVFVRVEHVEAKLSLARTYRTISTGGPSISVPSMFLPTSARVETLRKEEHLESAELDEADSIVKKGDPVVQVLSPDEVL